MMVARLQRCLILCVLILSACGSNHQKNTVIVIENPYKQRVQDLTHLAVEAMYKERWRVAEHGFERALQAAKLANDVSLIVKSRYNLGMAYKAQGLKDKAENILLQAQVMAKSEALQTDVLRISYVLALLNKSFTAVAAPKSGMAEDMYLYAGYVAQQQQHIEMAKLWYEHVLKSALRDRASLWLKAKAYMALAKLAVQEKNQIQMHTQAEQALLLASEIGMPRVSADALLILAQYGQLKLSKQHDYAQRAVDIYLLLHDQTAAKTAAEWLQP